MHVSPQLYGEVHDVGGEHSHSHARALWDYDGGGGGGEVHDCVRQHHSQKSQYFLHGGGAVDVVDDNDDLGYDDVGNMKRTSDPKVPKRLRRLISTLGPDGGGHDDGPVQSQLLLVRDD